MGLRGLYTMGGVTEVDPLLALELQKEQLKEKQVAAQSSSAHPSSWGEDRVSFSVEARNAAREVAAEDKKKREREEEEREPTATEEFAAYMMDTRNRAQSFDPEEQLEELQDKLKNLQSQLSQLATDDSPDAGKQAKIDNLNSQINSTMGQISELTALLAEQKSKEA